MVILKELLAFFEETAPKVLAEDYDNVGLLIEGQTDEICTLMLALDADEHVAQQAKAEGAELVVSHHPLLFHPLKRITESNGTQRTALRFIRDGIGLFAMHTNFDSASGGLCDSFLQAFGEMEQVTAFSGEAEGLGRIGRLREPCKLSDLLQRAKTAFNLPHVSYAGDPDRCIQTVAVCNGGGGDIMYQAHELGADVYISGDFKHYHARFAVENHFPILLVDHYSAEIGFGRLMQAKLTQRFGDRLRVLIADEQNPWRYN